MTLAKIDLGELLFVVFFVGLPLLRGLMEAAKKKARGGALEPDRARPRSSPRPVPPPGSSPEPEDGVDGRELWERLLRGELPGTETPPPVVVAAPREVVPPVPVVTVEPMEIADEEQLAEALARERAELAQRWGEAALEPIGAGAPDAAPELAAFAPATEPELAPLRFDRFDLRRAVLASEILGPPVSLRRDAAGGSTPPGLLA